MRALLLVALTGCSESILLADRLFDPTDAASLALAERLATEHLEATDGLVGVHEVRARKVTVDGLGGAHVRLAQQVDGHPVFGAEVRVQLDADGLAVGGSDALARDLELPAGPTLGEADAITRASGDQAFADARATLFAARWAGADRWVWQVELSRVGSEGPELPRVLVDANSGEEVLRWDDLQTIEGHATSGAHGAIDFPIAWDGSRFVLHAEDDRARTFDVRGASPEPRAVTPADLHDVSSSSEAFSDGVAATAHWGTVQTLRFYREQLGRDGVDGAGGPEPLGPHLTSSVHYGSAYNNAFWNGTSAYYGDGDGDRFSALVGLDVVAHELTHGVTDHTADLLYFTQSGALNESFSDVFGALVEEAVIGPDTMWTLGEGVFTPNQPGDAMRYLSDPTRDGSSTDHWTSRYTGPFDNGGVHKNSGIANLVFYLVAEGGQHPTAWHVRRGVQGIGTERAGRIWYHALAHELGWLADFDDARTATLNAARTLYGEGSFEEEAVANAWAEVGVGDPFGGPMDPSELPPQPTVIAAFEGLAGTPTAPVWRSVQIPAGTATLLVTTAGGTGDADLWLNHGEPSLAPGATPDCRSWEYGPAESCRIDNPTPGTWYVTLKTFYGEFSGVTAEVRTVAAP